MRPAKLRSGSLAYFPPIDQRGQLGGRAGNAQPVVDLADRVTGVARSDDWAGHDDWIMLDRSAGPDVCREMVSDESQLLWYEASQADDVWAMLAELRGRDETRRILVVRQVETFAAVDSVEIAALVRLCGNYRATLLVVVQIR